MKYILPDETWCERRTDLSGWFQFVTTKKAVYDDNDIDKVSAGVCYIKLPKAADPYIELRVEWHKLVQVPEYVPTIDLVLKHQPIIAQARKLEGKWTLHTSNKFEVWYDEEALNDLIYIRMRA
jgi:hypothetical protein